VPPVVGEEQVRARDRVLRDYVYGSPVDQYLYRSRRIGCWIVFLILLLIVLWVVWRFNRDSTAYYKDPAEHFKYGSIGAEPGGSLTNPQGGLLPPERIFSVLPAMFPDKLPGGYASLGFVYEPGHELPIGVTRRFRLGFEQVGVNCSVCHVGTYRIAPGTRPQIVLGMPANKLRLKEFFEFVIGSVLDPRFTPDNVIGTIDKTDTPLGPIDRLLYRYALIPTTVATTLQMKSYMGPLIGDVRVMDWGPGRVDTFNPYKALQFHWDLNKLPIKELTASSDYPSLWNQKPRGEHEMDLHWDGNNRSLDERNHSAALGAGVTPVTLDRPALDRVKKWVETLPPPPWPLPIDETLAARGQVVYAQYCTECHGDHRFRQGFIDPSTMGKLGTVEPWANVRTDRQRLDAYTLEFSQNQYTLYPESSERFRYFRKTDGYSNQPLDGIWLKAPYLHNGSVPTLRALLDKPEQRPVVFYRGYDVIDHKQVGFVYTVAEENGHKFFQYDTRLLGNSNDGHLWGTDLSPEDKDAIVEYMKKF
jgi:mono/diheme cytochrome c family protein